MVLDQLLTESNVSLLENAEADDVCNRVTVFDSVEDYLASLNAVDEEHRGKK